MARPRKPMNRRARQRRAQRAQQPHPTPQQSPASAARPAPTPEPMTTTSSATGSAATAAARPSASIRTAASQRASRANPRLAVGGPSRLSERAIEEYHYVIRDLRNIGFLLAVMVGILAVATVAFTALGIGRG